MNRKILEQIVEMNIPVGYRAGIYDLIVYGNLYKTIRRAFHLTKLEMGARIENDQREDIGGAWIDYAWSAEILGWLPHNPIILGVVKYLSYLDRTNVMHGILLIPKALHDYDSFFGSEPLRSVELPSLHDPVKNAILDLNLFEAPSPLVPDEAPSPIVPNSNFESIGIYLKIHNENGRRQINYGGQKSKDPTWIALSKAMIELLEELRQLYNDPEINQVLSARKPQ